MSVSVVTVCWGAYWEKFGQTWVSAIQKLDPKPDEVIIVSDREIEHPFIKVIDTSCKAGLARNAGIKAATSEWVVISDMDDQPYPNLCQNLDSTYDAVAFAFHQDGKVLKSSPKSWDRYLLPYQINEMAGTSAFKRDWLLRCPYRDWAFEDWALWIDFKAAGARVKFDPEPRFNYYRHNDARTYVENEFSGAMKSHEIIELKKSCQKNLESKK